MGRPIDARAEHAPVPQVRSGAEAPRFSLRFEAGRAVVSLARPLRIGAATLEALTLSVSGLRFPFDTASGPARFRTMRTRVESARVTVDGPALAKSLSVPDLGLSWHGRRNDGRWLLTLRDGVSSIAVECTVRGRGPDLCLAVVDARTAVDGPAPAHARVLSAARALGFAYESESGLFVAPRMLRMLLASALVPHGWRVPDERGLVSSAGAATNGALVLELGTTTTTTEDDGWIALAEEARALAPALTLLSRGDVAAAQRTLASVLARPDGTAHSSSGPAAESLRAALASFETAERVLSVDGSGARSRRLAAFRAACVAGHVDEVVRLARAIDEAEPSDGVAFDALLAAAELARDRLATRVDLLGRASARRPSDVDVLVRWIEGAARLDKSATLDSVYARAMSFAHDDATRARLAVALARSFYARGDLARAWALWDRAAALAPDDPSVLVEHARARVETGEISSAYELFERASHASLEPAVLHDVLCDAGDLLARLGRLDGAEQRYERARRLVSSSVRAILSLARARDARRDETGAGEAFAGLLSAEVEPSAELARGLAEAAAHHLQTGRDPEAAHAFANALERAFPSDPALDALRSNIARARADGWLLRPMELALTDLGLAHDVVENASSPGAAAWTILRAYEEALRREQAERPTLLLDVAAGLAARVDDAPLRARVVDACVGASHVPRLVSARAWFEASASKSPAPGELVAALRRGGHDATAARILARAGVDARDGAMLRAALEIADKAGASEVALEVIDLALGVLQGDAREELERRRRELLERSLPR